MAKKLQKWLAMCLVVCMCMSMFTIPAAATEQTTNCGKTAHEHGEACYTAVLKCEVTQDLTCVSSVHEHDSDCYHVHSTTAGCYAVNCEKQYDCDKQYDCTEEHEHIAECVAHVHGDACTKHTHIDTCYASEPSCEIDAVNPQCGKDVHVHGETCYVAHEHGNACYKSELTCTTEEHTHTDACVAQPQSGDQTIDQIPALMTLGLDETQLSAQSVEPITGTITEDMTWNNGDVIGGVTIADDVTITVNGTVTVAGTISMDTDSINTVTIQGGTDAKLIRGNGFTGQMFYVEGTSYNFQNLYFRDLTLDGGAVWRTGEEDAILKRGIVNDGISATGSILYLARANATLDNCVLQNQDDGTGEKANAVFLYGYATIAFNDSVVRNNNSPSGYWKGGVVATRYGGTVTANNSDVYGNSAAYGGFVGVSSSGSYGTKVECVNTKFCNNYASTAGAVFYLQDNGGEHIAGTGYVKLTGCALENNGSPCGLFYSHAYYMPAWIKDTTIANNTCSMYEYSAVNRGFSVAGNTKISGDYSKYLYEAPVRIYGALKETASIPMSEASVSQLMSNYGYLVTAAPDIPYHYNHTDNGSYILTYEYTCDPLHEPTLEDLAQVELYDGSGYTNWVLTDVDGNGMRDAVPVSDEPTTVAVNLVDAFKGINVTTTQDVSNVVKNVPVCYYEHPGYFFNGWLMEDGTLIKGVNSNIILNGGEVLTATWAVARPRVAISASTTNAKEGQPVTLTASISNMDAENLKYDYQWYRSGKAIEGATGTTYTVTESEPGYYTYKCVAVATDDDYTSDTDYASLTKYGTNTYFESITLKYTAAPDVAEIVETGEPYKSLALAVADANDMEKATIKMLKSIDFDSDEALPITSDVTIIGEHTISRGDYAGPLFEVKVKDEPEAETEAKAKASLTLDGGLTIDGGNNWTFDEATYKADRDSRTQVLKADYCTEVDGKPVYKYVTPAEGAPVVDNHMILVGAKGTVNLNNVTIQNEYGKKAGVVKATATGAVVTLKGATIKHLASMESNGVVVQSFKANTVVLNAGTVIDGNYVGGNHGLFLLDGGAKMTMNGGELKNTNGWNSNGVAVSVHGGAEFTMNDGLICGNSSVSGEPNARNMAVNCYAGSTVIMNGGMICHNIGNVYAGGIASYKETSNVIISGGRVVYNVSLGNDERYGAERGDDLDTPGIVSLTGGIFGHDVSQWCAPGYVSLPYDRDMSAYCDLSYVTDSAVANNYNEDTCATDYIVVPGYKVTYHTVDTKVTNAETGEQTTEIVTTPVHEEFLLIPKDKTYDEVDLFATPYSHRNSDNTKEIKTWYTKCGLNSENKVALSEKFDFNKTEVVGNLDLYGNTWVDVPKDDNSGSGSGTNRPSRPSRPSNRPSSIVEIEDELIPLAGGPQWLNTTDHYAYLAGFGDGTLRPYDGITRGQVATIFFRLLTDEAREEFWSETNDFTDCGEDLWCNTAISTLSNMGIIDGYQDGTFKPNAKVTRAQFAKIMVGFFGVDQFGYTGLFSDVAEGAWHSQYVETASRLGMIQGYNDGTFKPNANITRAQACVIVNRALVRVPDEEHLLPLNEMLTWTDNTPDDWFYADMMEATNSHDYMWLETETGNMEQWTEKLAQPDWAKLEKVWSETYGG